MKYEKAKVNVVTFDFTEFMTESPHDEPLGSFTCGTYKAGESCNNISWQSGYSCGVYTNGHCQGVESPAGSTGDGCYAWKLTCSKF